MSDKGARLTLTCGLPGSGKTTWAKAQPDAMRVNRDALRKMLGPDPWPWHDPIRREPLEELVTVVQLDIVRALLVRGQHVIVDDTNLSHDHYYKLLDLADDELSVDWEFVDFTDVPLETCIERDAARPEGERVGEDTIRRMHAKYLEGR